MDPNRRARLAAPGGVLLALLGLWLGHTIEYARVWGFQGIQGELSGSMHGYMVPFAAILAAGLYGIEHTMTLSPAFEGNAYESDVQRFPRTLRDAITALEQGTIAREALGDDVVDHYLNYANTEQRLFDKVVTEYERGRLFERG